MKYKIAAQLMESKLSPQRFASKRSTSFLFKCKMKLRKLETLLQNVECFEDPKIQLEQYPTGVHLAATILHTIDTRFESFDESSVIDLGAGTGILSIGCALLNCPTVLGVDIDPDCLTTARRNLHHFDEILPVDFVCCDVSQLGERMRSDVVVMNPPFGTKQKNADREFLKAAFSASGKSVYSLHKTSTRSFIHSFASKFTDSADVIAQLRYDLPRSYAFHKSDVKDIEVDLWRFTIKKTD